MVASSGSFIQSGSLHGNLVEILPKQLYFASFNVPPLKTDPHVRYIDLDNRVRIFELFFFEEFYHLFITTFFEKSVVFVSLA